MSVKMWLVGKPGSSKRGAGSIIGASFLLLILLSGYASYTLYVKEVGLYSKTTQDMHQLDLKRSRENIEFISVSFTSQNMLNITIENSGSYQAHLIWLGIFDDAANTQDYYKINFYVDQAETVSDIRNDTIPSFEGQERVLQLVTEFGNTFSFSYPEESAGDGEGYDWVGTTCDLHLPSAKGTHSLFSAQQAGPDGIADTLTEENTAGSSSSNQTASADLDRDDWISGQNSAGDVDAGVLSDIYSSDNTRYELVETKATGGGSPSNRNYLLAWRFDFTGISGSRTDTHVYIEAQTTGEAFRVYWSSDDVTMNYLGTITLTSDNWKDWDVPDDTSTTIYILFKDNNDERADGTDTTTADLIKIDALFLEITSNEVDNYELDLEVQWTEVDYDETNEWLSIYGGTMGAEDLLVDVWNSTTWVNVFTDLLSGWNSVDISSYLDSSTFIIRFRGGTETGDTAMDSWEIDATFLYVWTAES